MGERLSPGCARCTAVVCRPDIGAGESPDLTGAPGYCPMKLMPEVITRAMAEYEKPEVREFARQASVQEFEGYERLPDGLRPKNPRIVELIQFARKCGYGKLGIAFCSGLAGEAGTLTGVLENNGFEVVSVRCKAGAIPKEAIGIKPEEKIRGPDRWESMCNPIVQAEVLNAAGVDLAVLLGLCIGHDTLFFRYCRVPVTVLAVKDRVTGHNPLAPLYLTGSYYKRLMTGVD